MKNILLAFGLVGMSCTGAFAQATAKIQAPSQAQVTAQQAAIPASVTKSDLNKKISELNTKLDQNKTEDIQAKWNELHNMMLSELAMIKSKYREATESNNEADKTKYSQLIQSQSNLYYQVVNLKDNMVNNKADLNMKLSKFTAAAL